MPHLNVEIKARCNYPTRIREYLKNNQANFKGTDHQTDTYFNVAYGRLKLREGNIENALIFYERTNQAGPKSSHFELVKLPDATQMKQVLTQSLGIKVVVKKMREIYFIGNVKFHIDEVPGLGSFMEIEASNLYADLTKEELQKQCDFYLETFGIEENDLVSVSYSDMLINRVEGVNKG